MNQFEPSSFHNNNSSNNQNQTNFTSSGLRSHSYPFHSYISIYYKKKKTHSFIQTFGLNPIHSFQSISMNEYQYTNTKITHSVNVRCRSCSVCLSDMAWALWSTSLAVFPLFFSHTQWHCTHAVVQSSLPVLLSMQSSLPPPHPSLAWKHMYSVQCMEYTHSHNTIPCETHTDAYTVICVDFMCCFFFFSVFHSPSDIFIPHTHSPICVMVFVVVVDGVRGRRVDFFLSLFIYGYICSIFIFSSKSRPISL